MKQAEERERETLRTRLWQLINTEGAFSEENKASAREALTSGDSAEARKVIEKAEIRVARHKEFRANLELYSPTRSTTGGQPPADGAEVSSRVLFITEQIDGYHVSDDGVGPASQVSESSHTQGPIRPSTARPCSEHTAEPVTQRKRAQSARCRSTVAQDGSTHCDVLNNVAKANGIEVDHHPLDLSLAPSAKTQPCDSSPDPSACTAQTCNESDEDENADELHPSPKVSQRNSVLDCGAEDDGEKKFRFEKKSDKQHQWERWLNLAEQGKEASGEKETELRNYDDLVPEVKTPVVNMRKKGIARLPETFCFTLQHVQECDLSFNSLSSLPQTIGNLRDLKKLIVTDNRLQGLPFGLGHLKMLLELNIDRNSITRLPCSFAGTDSALTRGNTPFVLSTRGNTHFVLPPQNLIDEYSCVNIIDIPLRIETLNAIRTNLRHVLLAGIASRDKVWKELDARKMSLSTLLMLLTSPALHLGADTTNISRNCTSEGDLKRAGRSSSTELSFSREHLEEKLRWDIKLVDSKQTFTDLWEFLDEVD
jgi:Leucine-rich repeat (LRR) protein